MAAGPDNLVLEMLRQIRDDQQAMREDMKALDEKVETIDTKVGGNPLILTFIAGLVSDHEGRLTALEAGDREPAE